MVVYIESFCEFDCKNFHKLLNKDTTLVITGNKFGIAEKVKDHCKERNIPILIINPYDPKNLTDALTYMSYIFNFASEYIVIANNDSYDVKPLLKYAKDKNKRITVLNSEFLNNLY